MEKDGGDGRGEEETEVGKAGGGRMVLNRNEGVEPLGVGCLKGGPMTKGQHRTKDAVA